MQNCTRNFIGSPGKFTDYQRVLDAREQKDGCLSISLRFPTLCYIEEFIALKCAMDMLELELFPNAKEITESFACYRAARKHVPFEPGDPDVTLVLIGDGRSPRTAATFAFRSNWNCISIDPQLARLDRWSGRIKRLSCIAKKIEYVGKTRHSKLVIVAPHSHAPLDVALDRFQSKHRHVIAMPCCVDQVVPARPIPDKKYDDWGVHSPQRSMLIWNDI